MDLDALRERNNNGKLDRMLNTMQKTSNFKKKTYEKDENEWTLTRNKAGNGHALIRFLPGIEEEGVVFVELLNHGFKHKGRWYIENCPRTIGQECPACDYRWGIINEHGGWEHVPEDVKKQILGPRNNKKSYYCNILVIEDPANPENDGKVFRFRFGQKIYEKIVDKLNPEFESEVAFDVSDPDEGANFRLKCKKVSGFPNYDSSEFEAPSKLKNKAKVLKAQHELLPIVAEDKFKAYEELEKKFYDIVGGNAPVKENVMDGDEDSQEDSTDYAPDTPVNETVPEPPDAEADGGDANTDDDDYFKQLADDIV